MGITQLTLFLLPCCLFWAMNPVRLLQMMTVAAIFEAGAALTIGSLGVQPGLMPGLGFLGFITLQLLLGARYPGAALTWPLVRPFVIVTAWAVASSILLPRLLEGQVYVWPQKNDPPFAIRPLQPTSGNINQDAYLLIDCGLLLLTSTFLSSPAVRLRPLINTYLVTGFLVAGISAWQFANKMAGVPFPDQLFYSNPGVSILTAQSVGAIPRLNGPFSEPSSLAGYMASIVCCSGWLLIRGHTSLWLRLLLLAGLGTMILSTSTTGFAVLVMAGVLVPGMAAIKGDTRLMIGITRLGLPLVLVIALAGLVASVVQPTLFSSLNEIADSSLNKKDSSSYEERTSADIDSLTAFVDSYGLGAGWGSNRSSSLIPGLLASVGVPGMIGLGWFGTFLAKEVSRARRLTTDRNLLFVIDGCCGALTGYLLGAVISAPALTSTTFYYLLAVLIAAIAKIKIENIQRYYARAARQGRLLSGGVRQSGLAGAHARVGMAASPAVRSPTD
jgi:hypothetical protein